MRRPLWVIFLLGILIPLQTGAEVYKWVDENGVVHYTDRPPEGRQATRVELTEPPPRPEGERAAATVAEPGAPVTVEEADAAGPPAAAETAPAKALRFTAERVRCVEAWLAIRDLEKRGDVYEDEAGKIHRYQSFHSFWYESYRKLLSDSERREYVDRFEDEMKRSCDISRRQVRNYAEEWERRVNASQCAMARAKLARLQGPKTPAHTFDHVRKMIEEYCD